MMDSKNQREPLAIVSMACRFPKLDSIDELWSALCSRFNAADTVPADRWDANRYFSENEASKGKTWTRRGGFVNQDVKTFDASFFGISPREAENMDPQQRLILEVVWEAFENCGMVLPNYAGRPVGVYVGGFMLDHMITSMGLGNRSTINQHTAAGMMMTMLSNRVSHTFDLRGPSLSIDTACSSSLVAFHYGCQDVWRGACELAVIGGTNVMMRPEYPIGMSKGHFISRDGESKSFDQRGDGYGRGEGAGVVLVKPLAQAQADGDTILSLVLATGTNQDGRTSGISMPNGEAQLALINEVCTTNGIDPSSVDYVECHGTGTGIGDPTECSAIGSTYGAGRQDNPVVIGSIKSNIGHTEAVAGVAGIIKASLNCMHRTATPLGNLQTPREDIDFENLGIRLSDDLIPLGEKDKPVTAAVNSFGYGGSNAHVILQSSSMDLSTDSEDSAKIVDTEKAEHEVPYALPVSGRSKDALIANAARLAEWMENTEKPLDDIIYSASMRRAHFNFRSVAMGRNRKELISALQDIAQDQENDLVVHDAQPIQGQRQPVYVFTGMGPQWWYMGQELYANQRIYREYAHLADAAFAKVAGFSILSEMLKPEDSSQIQKTIYAQPANLIIQIGVFEMLKAQGLQPGMIVGHSVGELGSAYAAGVLSLEDAMLVSFHRSQLQAETAGLGGMLAIGKSKADAQRYIEPYSELVSFAAINGPTSVTLAGCVDTLKLIEEQLTSEGVFAKALDVEIPYHSPMMQPLMERLEQALLSIEPKIPSIPLYSTVTGEQVTDVSFGADYWPLNIRQPVEFEAAIMSIMDSGYNTFVEIGPHPVLSASLRDCAKLAGKDCRLIHTLRRNLPNESRNIHRAMMSVFTAGCDFNWTPFLASETFVQLPNYQWQREHYWIENNRAMQDRVNPIVHPILGTQEALASAVWRNDFDHHSLHYLRDHVVSSLPILPAAGYLESLLELAAIQFPDDAGLTLRDVEISAPLILTPDAGIDFTTSYDPVSQATLIRSQENGRLGTAQVHVTSRIGAIRHAAEAKVDFIRQSADQSDDVIQFYKKLDQNGLSYGPMFQTVQELHVQREKGAVVARLALNSALLENLDKYKLHPTLLDGCFQTLMALLSDEETTYLPTNIGELCYYGQSSPAELWCIGELTQKTERELTCSLSLVDQEGNLIVSIRDFIATAASKPERVDKWGEKVRLEILNYQWDYGESLGEPKRLGHWLAVGDGGDFASAVSERIQGLGAKVVANVNYGESYAQSDRDFTVAFDSVNDAREVLSATGELSGIVFYVAMDNTLRHDSPTAEKSINALLVFTQALLELPAEKRPRVYVATQSAFIVNEDDEAVDPGCSAVNGYVRVAFNELEDFHFTSIDLPDDLDDEETLDAFVFELLCDAEEDEIAIRDESRMVTELLEDKVLTEDVILPTQLDDEHPIAIRPLRAETDSVGMVRVLSSSKATPTQNDIHIRVEASLLPKNLLENQKSTEIGQAWVEIVGEIIDVGSNVQDLQKGDRVCGFAPADLSSHLCGDRNSFHLVRIPKDADAALLVGGISLPVCAHHAVAAQHIESGDTALVQYSPMGMAVASVLAARGVKVTLLSDTPDDLDESIRNLYPVYLASPANIERAIAEQTDGNNFSGMVVMLSEWGREYDFRSLVEGGWIINTSDLNTAVQLTGSIGSVSRTALGAALNKPSRFATILQDVVGDIIEGRVESDPTLDVSIVDIAWQNLALPEMTTRIVIDYETGGKDLPMVQPDQLAFAQNATYLITGGLGGFGHKTAEWLIDNGAKHLVLTGRSGASKPAAKAILEHLQSLGATVTAAACDTSDIESLSALFDEIAETMPPLKGIFHCGAVIADQAISDADLETVNSVMRSKATGAYNLHVLSKNIELDHFILYSSIANQIGNGRQCAYSAANGYLNGLAHMRALQGLPGTAINWGAIDDVGVVAEDEKIELFFKAVGVRAIPVMEALDILRLGMSRQTTQFGAMLAQWADWARYESIGGASLRYKTLIEADSDSVDSDIRDQLVAELAPLSEGDRAELMGSLIQQIVASVLKSDAEKIELDRPINELGIDSLMATEIQLAFESDLGLSISVLELIGDTTIRSLATHSLDSMSVELQTSYSDSGSVEPAAAQATSDNTTEKNTSTDRADKELSEASVTV